MKVAFATTTGERVDQHFGWATDFHVYEVSEAGSGPAEIRLVPDPGPTDNQQMEDDRIAVRLDAIADCAMLYVAAIGGTAAARVIRRRIHPVKVTGQPPVAEILDQLESVLKGTPPPWMRKLINPGPAVLEEV